MLALPDALARVLAGAVPLSVERVALGAVAGGGRVLARSVHAPLALPPWDNSAMDGYAVRAADVIGATLREPVALRVLETVAAGAFAARRVAAGEAIRIMTGAPMPVGADCVIRVEDTDGGVEQVVVRAARDAGRNVRAAAEDLAVGAVAVAAGTPLRPADLALLAAVGAAEVELFRRPRVALLGSGDELVPLERFAETREGARIVASNAYALAALVRDDGGEPVALGTAPDDPAAIGEYAARAAGCDLLVTTAGASVGAFDYTRQALDGLGLALAFWRVAIRPGAQTAFGRLRALGDMPWLGLPGNPVSAQVTYELFVRPLLRVLQGDRRPHRHPMVVTLDEPLATPAPLTHFLRATLAPTPGGAWRARLTGPQGSGLLTSMARADALLVVPEHVNALPAGAQLRALPLGAGALCAAESAW